MRTMRLQHSDEANHFVRSGSIVCAWKKHRTQKLLCVPFYAKTAINTRPFCCFCNSRSQYRLEKNMREVSRFCFNFLPGVLPSSTLWVVIKYKLFLVRESCRCGCESSCLWRKQKKTPQTKINLSTFQQNVTESTCLRNDLYI